MRNDQLFIIYSGISWRGFAAPRNPRIKIKIALISNERSWRKISSIIKSRVIKKNVPLSKDNFRYHKKLFLFLFLNDFFVDGASSVNGFFFSSSFQEIISDCR